MDDVAHFLVVVEFEIEKERASVTSQKFLCSPLKSLPFSKVSLIVIT